MVENVLKSSWNTRGTSTTFPWWNTRVFHRMLCLGIIDPERNKNQQKKHLKVKIKFFGSCLFTPATTSIDDNQ